MCTAKFHPHRHSHRAVCWFGNDQGKISDSFKIYSGPTNVLASHKAVKASGFKTPRQLVATEMVLIRFHYIAEAFSREMIVPPAAHISRGNALASDCDMCKRGPAPA